MKKQKPSLINRIICRLGLCAGHMDHERDSHGVSWIGLRCTATGKLHNPVKSKYQDTPANRRGER